MLKVAGLLLLVAVGCGLSAAFHTRPPNDPDGPVQRGACTAGVRKVDDLQPGSPPGLFGTPHPINVEAASPDGRWISACQARSDTDGDGFVEVLFGRHGEARGDRMRPYLIVGGGAGHRIDELIGRSPGGHYVAVREADCLDLVDTVGGTSTTLVDADLRDPEPALGPRRGVSFDAVDKRVLYLRAGSDGDRVVVRDLASGRETEIDPGPGLVVRAVLDPEGEFVLIDAAMGDRLPRLQTTLARRSCRGSVGSFSVFGSKEPRPAIVRRIAPASGGATREVPGLIRSFGSELLLRADDGSLVVEDAGGERRTIAPAACGARVSHIDAGRRLVLFVCKSDAGENGLAPLSLYRDGTTTKLRAIDQVRGSDEWTQTTGGYVRIYTSVIDLEQSGERPPASAYAGLPRMGSFIRNDGLVLRPLREPDDDDWKAMIGPLRWVQWVPPAN